jgi:hypothetical protein
MFSLSPVKLMVIVAVVVILLGPDKLPDVARTLSQWWQKARQYQQRVETEWRQSVPDLPASRDLLRYARNPVSLLDEWGAGPTPKDPTPRPPGLTERPTGPSFEGPDPSLN